MAWNWQQPDWPDFTWSPTRLTKAEERFLVRGGVVIGTAGHLDDEERQRLTVESICSEAMTTSEIEGEILDRDSVQSSIRHELGLATDDRRVAPAERGIAEMMVDLHQLGAERLDHETLQRWHTMLCLGRRDLRDVGRYRAHGDPMRVVSGRLDEPRVHFEAPPSSAVADEMDRFMDWFQQTAPDGDNPLPALTRAGIAHLYFVSIHPFEDGNGRIARAIAEKSLAQSLGQPSLTALAATILLRRRSYYERLEAANKSNEITNWLAWSAGIALEAQARALAQVEFLIDKANMLDRLRGQLNDRQDKALLRLFATGPEGFTGGLSAGNYASITKASPASATRDLADLVAKDAMRRTGEKKHTRYQLTIPLRRVAPVTIDEKGEIVTPNED